MTTTFIYALKDPKTNEIRYIGKANNPYKRYQNHINKCRDKNTHKRNWINKLKDENLKPILEILEEVPVNNWSDYEKKYIKKYINEGCNLVNYTEGGDGSTFGNKGSFKKGDGGKRVVMLDKNGNYIKTFDTLSEISFLLNVSVSNISSVLRKKRKTTRNFSFLYEIEYLNMSDQDLKNHIEWLNPKIVSNKTSFKEVKIYQYDKNKKLIKEWKSLAEASKELKINKSAICQCAKGDHKTAGGYIWKYK